MKNHRIIRSLFLILFLASCDGMKSEIKSPYFPEVNVNLKPNCPFKLANNCWQRSINKMMSCLPVHNPNDQEYFSNDFLKCENENGKRIRFEKKFNPNMDLKIENLDFRVYNKDELCFQFIGNQSSFVIDSLEQGSIAVHKLENGDTLVSCLNGESLVLTNEIKEKGCRDQNEKVGEFLPSAQLFSTESLRSEVFSFFILGNGTRVNPLFSCQLKD